MKTTTEIINLANTGVNLVADTSKKTTTELLNLCLNFSKYITLDLS